MLVPVKWLNEYVDFDINCKELADKLTMSGSHVDSIESIDKGIEKVVVGKIKSIEKHPDADKLVITKIDIGNEEIQIVTGANNIKEGDFIPVALVGAKLPGGIKIKKGKLRGIESRGMLCSINELGVSDDLVPKEQKDGIYILDKEYELGMDIKEALGIYGEIIEFEITPNRPDCLSIIGMARETAATLKKELKFPEIKVVNEVDDINNYVNNIEIVDKDLCKRYYAKVVKDVKVTPSPMWLQRKLIEAGIRPINNIVDVTNYVMLELGQPIHAFDLNKIEDKEILIRKAKDGEKIVTLDNVERNLSDSMLVIADSNKPIAIAGVMGGANSEVSDDTKVLLIESANFDGRSVRITSRGVSLRTEASAKFEKDIDPNLADIACIRVCQILEEINAGVVIKGEIDIYNDVKVEKVVELRPKRVEKLLGVKIETDEIIKILNSLELKSVLKEDTIDVKIPTFRGDISLEADLIEEVGRIYGFHNIESAPLIGTLTKGERSRGRKIEDIIKEELIGLGLNEITTYSFISPKAYDKINLPEESIKRRYIELLNPLGEDYSVMRTTLTANMLEVLTRNYKHGVESARAFEVGKVFIPQSLPVNNLPYEIKTLCVGMYGKTDFFETKGIIESVFNRLGVKDFEYDIEKNNQTFHPGRTANIIKDNHVIGIIGEIHPLVLENFGIKERVIIAEIDLDVVNILTNFTRKYKELPKYPAISRDIAVVVERDLMIKDIEKDIKKNSNKLVEKIELFDVYTGSQIPEDKKSVAYSIQYRANDRTLTDEEVSKVHNKIVNSLTENLKAELRS